MRVGLGKGMGWVRPDWGYLGASPAPQASSTWEKEGRSPVAGKGMDISASCRGGREAGHPGHLMLGRGCSGPGTVCPTRQSRPFSSQGSEDVWFCRGFSPPRAACDGPREPHGACWGSPSIRGHVCRRVPDHAPWCWGGGGPGDTPSQLKAVSCGGRRECWGPQGQGTFANTTLNVNQLSLPWYL